MTAKTNAFLFDLNGTMIDDMQYHIKAWHTILNELGAGISYERTKAECYGKNDELLERVFPGRFSRLEKTTMGYAKEEKYQRDYRHRLKLLDGLDTFIRHAREQQVLMAIGSAAIRFNIDFVLDGLEIRNYFSAIVSAEDVMHSKPHPETYLKCAEKLGVDPSACIVFEDVPKGVESALRAGMKAFVINTNHEMEEFSAYNNIISFSKDFRDLAVSDFINIH